MAAPSRTSMTRAANGRPAIGGADGGTLHVDTSAMSGDLELMWATEQVLGADYRENVRLQMQTRGFQPVMVGEMPGEAPPLFPGEKRDEHALIRRGGMVLMKREKRIGLAERQDMREDNVEALRSVNRELEETVNATPGMERLKDSGVTERIERRSAKGAFPE
jgi:hypothetical protein